VAPRQISEGADPCTTWPESSGNSSSASFAPFLVLGGIGVAAAGGNFKLGESNAADKPTVLQNTANGAVLDLKAKTGQPPLKVNSNRRVPKLNADLLDGKNSSLFALKTGVYSRAQSDAKYALTGSS
jgi:hypothetical protein